VDVHEKYKTYLEDQSRFFDELIEQEGDDYAAPSWDYSRTFEVRRLFQKIRPHSVLDIGCGRGFRDVVIAEQPSVQRVEAIDYSARSIRTAQTRHPDPKVMRHVADFATYHPAQQYDLIVSFQVFEHLNNPDAYFQFCADHCVPDGYVAISTVNRLRLTNRLRARKGLTLVMEDAMHFREYTRQEIELEGQRFGLVPFDWFGYALYSLPRLNYRQKTWGGYLLPWIASRLVVVFQKPNELRKPSGK
jgi:2-polyprenyl-3-methyl-5-hydroxy-6-metoxy-1,4-benzoquinol methylase